MGNSLRCCIACMLPCGALDVVRVVHVNGHVEEFSKTVKAGEVMKAHPKHVIRKSSCQGIVHRIIVLPPDAELQRGNIYFLIPTSCLQNYKDKDAKISGNSHKKSGSSPNPASKRPSGRRSRREQSASAVAPDGSQTAEPSIRIKQCGDVTKLVISEQYLADVLSEKAQRSGRHSRKNSRVGVWRPHLESISEVASL
ncbi:hypothetical protein SUGI_0761980 [Cryptomeria japonica]|uniref:uncharacterized protein LOC131071201 n=1 Tax=Cryptomeria japonica TaxID=3369 RepID=UPI002414A5BC|nr:uncharacterized protein LOC131071201 [Cryptomeria japonica]GLJ37503.1 hypothetical protein SUGI_0761980 [Cryptomeria japonica]